MFRKIKKFAMSRTGQRVIAWLAPVVIGWITSRLSSNKSTKKNK